MIILILDLLVIGICSIVTFPLSRLIGLFSKDKRDNFCFSFVKLAMKSFLFYAGTDVKYIGLENLPKKGESVVYIGNHRGFFDIVGAYAVFPTITGFIAKQEMRKWPLIGWWMNSVYCLFLNRTNKKEGLKTILEGIKNVQNGKSMVIYPEGHRSHTEGVMGAFHYGSFKLATKAKADIIPVITSNTGAVLDDHAPLVKRTSIIIEFGERIPTANLTPDELQALPDKVHELILEKHIANSKSLGVL